MLKPADLAAKMLTSADEHKRTATNLRRLTGGIAAQRDGSFGLSDSEKSVLAAACQLLDRMADVASQASKLRKKADEAAEARRAAIKSAAASNFGRLSSVADKVALIGAVQSYSLRNNAEEWATSKHMLPQVFREALDQLTWTLAGSNASEPADQVVAQAWEKFQLGRAAIEDQHARLIVAQQRMHGEQLAGSN
ncbi:MAG: hypothetical protein ACOZE7_04445 [Pseudomonadota bacterium]